MVIITIISVSISSFVVYFFTFLTIKDLNFLLFLFFVYAIICCIFIFAKVNIWSVIFLIVKIIIAILTKIVILIIAFWLWDVWLITITVLRGIVAIRIRFFWRGVFINIGWTSSSSFSFFLLVCLPYISIVWRWIWVIRVRSFCRLIFWVIWGRSLRFIRSLTVASIHASTVIGIVISVLTRSKVRIWILKRKKSFWL